MRTPAGRANAGRTSSTFRRVPRHRIAVAWSIAALAAFVTPQAANAAGQYEPAEGIERASRFDAYPVHFAGNAVSAQRLSAVLGGRDSRRTSWSFIYGKCASPAGEGGCPPPLEVQTTSTCFRYRDMYPGKQSSFRFRGAQASREGGANFEIYSGRVTVSIFGSQQLVDAAAKSVRPIGASATRTLAAPARGSLRGELRCQETPEEPPFPFATTSEAAQRGSTIRSGKGLRGEVP